jgi:omega-amidase
LIMRAHLVQSDIAWEDKQENYRRVAAMLDDARPAPGDLVVLPEMFDTGFSFRLEITADRDSATLHFLQSLAKKHQITLQGARSVIGPDGKGRNRASVIGYDGTTLGEYDKIHPFSFGRETEFFSGGDQVLVYPWRSGGHETTVCPAICYDLRFPELFRRGMKAGAEVLALGANWPAPRALHRTSLAQARAIENQAYMLCVNRAGADPHLTYAGASVAFGPKGEVLGQLGEEPEVLSVEIDLAALRDWRSKFPATRDVKLI